MCSSNLVTPLTFLFCTRSSYGKNGDYPGFNGGECDLHLHHVHNPQTNLTFIAFISGENMLQLHHFNPSNQLQVLQSLHTLIMSISFCMFCGVSAIPSNTICNFFHEGSIVKEIDPGKFEINQDVDNEETCNNRDWISEFDEDFKVRLSLEELEGPFSTLPPEVLEHIWGYLSPDAIMSVRQANSFFYQVSSPFFTRLRIRAEQSSIFLPWYLDNYHFYSHQNLSLNLDCASFFHQMIPKIRLVAKNFKELSITYTDEENNPAKLLFLQELLNSSPNLERLELRLHLSNTVDEFKLWDSETCFKKLKSISIHVEQRGRAPTVPGEKWCQRLIESTINVQELRIPVLNDFTLSMMDLLYLNPSYWPKLDSLSLEYDECYCLPQSVLEIRRPLKKISISTLPIREVPNFVALLEQHKNSLESIRVRICVTESYCDHYRYELPCLPRLKRISINIWEVYDESGNRNFFMLKETLEKPETFQSKFPVLSSLEVVSERGFTYEMYDSIFPEKSQPIPQIKYLDVMYPYEDCEKYRNWCIRLTNLFPNVNNQHLNRARCMMHLQG